jgi:hypothetical protein
MLINANRLIQYKIITATISIKIKICYCLEVLRQLVPAAKNRLLVLAVEERGLRLVGVAAGEGGLLVGRVHGLLTVEVAAGDHGQKLLNWGGLEVAAAHRLLLVVVAAGGEVLLLLTALTAIVPVATAGLLWLLTALANLTDHAADDLGHRLLRVVAAGGEHLLAALWALTAVTDFADQAADDLGHRLLNVEAGLLRSRVHLGHDRAAVEDRRLGQQVLQDAAGNLLNIRVNKDV